MGTIIGFSLGMYCSIKYYSKMESVVDNVRAITEGDTDHNRIEKPVILKLPFPNKNPGKSCNIFSFGLIKKKKIVFRTY